MEFSGWSLMAVHYSLIFTINYELLMTLAESEFSEARGVSGIIPSTQCRGTTINHLVRPAKSERSETRSVGRTIPGAKRRGATINHQPLFTDR